MATQLNIAVPEEDQTTRESRRLYHAYRHARAAWDVRLYAPEMLDADVPEEISSPLSNAHTEALNSYLLTPAGDAYQFALKMTVFREEEIYQLWFKDKEIVAALEADAWNLYRAGKGA